MINASLLAIFIKYSLAAFSSIVNVETYDAIRRDVWIAVEDWRYTMKSYDVIMRVWVRVWLLYTIGLGVGFSTGILEYICTYIS